MGLAEAEETPQRLSAAEIKRERCTGTEVKNCEAYIWGYIPIKLHLMRGS